MTKPIAHTKQDTSGTAYHHLEEVARSSEKKPTAIIYIADTDGVLEL